jgi:hypothetical protein
MKSKLCPGIIAGISLVFALSAGAQTQSAAANNGLTLPTSIHNAAAGETYKYDYDFISKGYVWSNKPLQKTATKICTTMKEHAFSETPYGINSDKDWNSCLDTQIQSIGYMRWLRNSGFKLDAKNRRDAKTYLQNTYTMSPWGGYSFAQLRQAFEAAKQQHP